MDNAPSTTSAVPSTKHPRRPPAHQSVSLRHSPPATRHASPYARISPKASTLHSPTGPASDEANPPSSVSPRLLGNKHSSGESSDAGKWFETTNNNARQGSASYINNDPPFFLRNSSSSESPPEPESQYGRMYPSMPYRPGLPKLGTDGSSTEDFRSVIDDLTIANKRLKQKLRKYEKLYDDHLENEKLFEVRFHGLPDHKKKELEDTLRNFAAGLDDGPATEHLHISRAPAFEQQQTAESGYASMSASGQNSSAVSNQMLGNAEPDRKMSKSAYHRQQQSIQSYLHDVSLGVPPKHDVPMTEKSKKKLVVRQLEQIFAGKQSVPGSHAQPMQQEEVAQSAATADRREREATGRDARPEGLREARIMPKQNQDLAALDISEQDFASSGQSPDQRPTRPLDLDPSRAQLPLENMDYFRHLGFTPPDMLSGEASDEGHGWLYLNLLINMAQLHTLHVTPDFVKDALTDYSSHFELSHDGRKVRWKGGCDVTTHSSDGSSEQYNRNSPSDFVPGSASPSKQIKTGNSGTSNEFHLNPEQRTRKLARAKRASEQGKFAYTPLFFHKDDSEDDNDFYNTPSGNSLLQSQQPGNSSRMGNSATQNLSSRKRRDDGPIIFYNRAKFCTDLTGDRVGASLTSPGAYKAIVSQPLGDISNTYLSKDCPSDLAEPRGPLDAESMDIDSRDGSRTVSSDEGFSFSPDSLSKDSSNSNEARELTNFEASGLGGVHPDDNFSIRVRRSQTQIATCGVTRRRSTLYPQKILDVLNSQPAAKDAETSPISPPLQMIKEQILSASRTSLPSSALPPASFLPFDSLSSGAVDSDYDSDASSEGDSESGNEPTNAIQLPDISRHDNAIDEDTDDEYDDDSDDSDDGVIDLLATARQIDPNTILASEREYDAAIADRLAEEIVAGSSAATVGGGSGFNTPADPRTTVEDQEISQNETKQSITSGSTSSRAKLKRARTNDSSGTLKMGPKGLKSQKTE